MSDLELKERIFTAAREYFFTNGFSKVTMEEFAQSMGMSKKTIYKFFPSKDDIVKAITREQLITIDNQCKSFRNDSSMEFIDRIKSTIGYLTTEMQKMKPQFYIDIQRTMPDLWKEVDNFRNEKVTNDFALMVQQGVDLDIFRSDVNVQVFVLMYSSAMRSIVNPETLSHLPLNLSQAYQAAVTVFFEGMMTDEGRSKYRNKLNEPMKEEVTA
ncbi:MAG: TetR/AcrR family transcriptional regulator [Bacteroidota bacterium]|nr:TetR/AcrR family transcriptional regulator [Bacteroidota bacterium]